VEEYEGDGGETSGNKRSVVTKKVSRGEGAMGEDMRDTGRI